MEAQFADLLASDPRAARVWAEGSQRDARLSPSARLEFDKLMLRLWKVLEGQFWAHRLGSVRNSDFKTRATGAIAMYRVPAVQEYFAERHMMYSTEFIEFLQTGKLDGEVVNLPPRSPDAKQQHQPA